MKSLIEKIMDLAFELSKIKKFVIGDIEDNDGTNYTLICPGHNDYILIYGGHIIESGPRSRIIAYLL